MNWKVIEEEKVVALVTGSMQMEGHCNAIIAAVKGPHEGLKKAVKAATKAHLTLNFIQRIIDLARQGHDDIGLESYDYGLQRRRRTLTVSGAEFSNNSVRIPDAFFDADRRGRRSGRPDGPDRAGSVAEDASRRASCGTQ